MILSDLGAEIIKVYPQKGDDLQRLWSFAQSFSLFSQHQPREEKYILKPEKTSR